MIVILIKDKIVLNVDSEKEKVRHIEEGWRELTHAEIEVAGMMGYEPFVSPANTVVNDDGSITFTPPPAPELSELRTAALSRIDSATSAAILAGFEYTIDNETLHFSYDSFDQQNFADTANGALLALQNVEGIPTTVEWNGYRNHTEEQKGELVRLVLDVPKFLDLYIKGALAHKDTHMGLGGKRKAIISNCTTVESIEMYMKSWYGK